MVSLHKDNFDSKSLGCNVYKMDLTSLDLTVSILKSLYKNKNVDLIACFSPVDPNTVHILEKENFRLISVRSTYRRALEIEEIFNPIVSPGYRINYLSKSNIPVDDKTITRLARQIYITGRYYQDPQIPKSKSLNLYKQWMKNSLDLKFAQEVLLLTNNDYAAGFLSLKIKEGNGFIDLIIIDSKYRNRGLGSVLMQEGFLYFQKRNIKNIFVSTAAENITANIFYQKNFFRLNRTELVLHKHFNKNL